MGRMFGASIMLCAGLGMKWVGGGIPTIAGGGTVLLWLLLGGIEFVNVVGGGGVLPCRSVIKLIKLYFQNILKR